MNPERILPVNGVDLCVQTFGAASDPALLLIGGAEASMDWWDTDLCERLADGARFVIRYDTRDTGRSTTFPVGAPPYDGEALVADAVGVLDSLGITAAHVVGISMGGGIAQHVAVRHPDRLTALTLISTTPDGPGGPGHPDLPPMSERLAAVFAQPSQDAGPDWSDREAVIAYYLEGEQAFAGSVRLDEPRLRRMVGRAYDRSPDMPAAQNHWMLEGSDPVRDGLGGIRVPTLVLHGTEDPLFPYGHGEALAREIPGATLVPLPGVGHQMPPYETWDTVVPAILDL
ncbi:pimeloyl-ACP methyl ester carboxylesterase [Nocardiopsis sp. Huas11]|uniref:alpha/beta fold hydrolase n=1 Tax=Nocardiopsis sp. Huas11 TaxID=2183912 RepID=UPI000F2458F6|nr:alpha/beta hydrolase [Nocardiopsis sp. Huas11]RKS09418.1 pimeloyl-ACP methyl ester carboxylesterase [Nocardiopsis sp. Huas11]